MTSVGYATLQVIPSAKGFQSSLGSQLGTGAAAAGATAGKQAGKGFSGGLLPVAGKAIPVLGGALAALGGVKWGFSQAQEAAQLETAIAEVTTLFGETGVKAEESIGKIRDQILGLSDDVGIAQETLVSGLYQAISSGVPRKNAFEFMRVASQAAIGGVTDVTTAVDGITTVVNAFGLKAKDAERVSDSLFTAVKGGKTTFGELSASLYNVAPAAAAVGVPIEEVNAAIATLTATGTPTSVATTQIRSALVGLQKPTKETQKAFKRAGYESGQAAIEAIGLGGALEIVTKASGGSNAKLQKMLGRVEAVNAAQVLTGKGSKKFASELKAQGDAAGATAAAYETIAESSGRRFEALGVKVSNIGSRIGTALLPTLEKIVGFVEGSVLPVFTDILGGGSGGALAPIVDAFRGLGEIVAPLGEAFSRFLQQAKPVIDFLIEVVGGTLTLAFEGIVGVVEGVLGTIGGIIETFAGIFTGDWNRAWEGLKQVVSSVGKAIIGAVKIFLVTGVGRVLGIAGKAILGLFRRIWTPLRGIVSRAFGAIRGVVSRVWNAIVAFIRGVVSRVVNTIRSRFQRSVAIVRSVMNAVRNVVRNVWNAVRNVITTVLNAIKNRIQSVWNAIRNVVSNVMNRVKSVISSAWNAAKNVVSRAMNAIKNTVSQRISAVLGFFRALPGRIVGALAGLAGRMVSVGSNIISGLISGIKGAVGRAVQAVKDAVGSVIQGAKNLLGINSPSKVFQGFGANIGEGLILGMNGSQRAVRQSYEGLLTPPAPSSLAGSQSATGSGGVAVHVHFQDDRLRDLVRVEAARENSRSARLVAATYRR